METNSGSRDECGCTITTFSTTEKCPACGEKLKLTGKMQLLEFKLICGQCGYQSAILSPEKVGNLL